MSTVNTSISYGEEWADCHVCSRCWPVSKLRRHPRFGVECPDCWDGGPHRDEILPKVYPGEGTRLTDFPSCPDDTGIDEDEETRFRFTLRDQTDRSNYWRVTFPGSIFTWTTGVSPGVEGWIVDGVWTVYFAGGLLMYDSKLLKGAIQVPQNLNAQVISGVLQWGPIT